MLDSHAIHTQTRRQGDNSVCPASLEGSLQMCTGPLLLPAVRFPEPTPTHSYSSPLSLFIFKEKKKEADGDRRQASRADEQILAAAFQGKQLIPRTCPLLDMQDYARSRAEPALGEGAAEGCTQPFFIHSQETILGFS